MQPRNGIHELQGIEAALARLGLCEGVGPQAIRELAMQARMLRVPRGHVVLRRGERPAGVFAIVCGALKARLQAGEGDEVIVELLGPGGTFGKAASVLGHPSKVDVVALEESRILEIGAAGLLVQMTREPRLARNVAGALAAQVQALTGELEHNLLPALQRLASYLVSIAQPCAAGGSWAARLPVTKTVLAARLGMKKETLSRLLAQLARRKVIDLGRREITIRDRDWLARISSDPTRAA